MICAGDPSAESWAMTERPAKITFAQTRNSGVRGILVYCCDYKVQPFACDAWPDATARGSRAG